MALVAEQIGHDFSLCASPRAMWPYLREGLSCLITVLAFLFVLQVVPEMTEILKKK